MGAVPGHVRSLGEALAVDDETGNYTRLVRADPGFEGGEIRSHDFWEESYILAGSFEEDGVVYGAGTFVCNQPGFEHGSYRSDEGWLSRSGIRYFPPGEKGDARR